ncbi:MAG: hypothetical protein JWQ98_1464 [Chlorobi bacterium]|nr:hypothetical protein [Chlorobiota bacterium]
MTLRLLHAAILAGLLLMIPAAARAQYAAPAPAPGIYTLPDASTPYLKGSSTIKLGGLSGLFYAGGNEFWAITDRGGNIDSGSALVFPVPDFSPTILKVRLNANGTLAIIDSIRLRRPDGTPTTGLPNLPPYNTGEVALDINLNVLPNDDWGYDSEGLLRAPDGTFWVSDEYGPSISHVSATGQVIARFRPQPSGGIPDILRKRVVNKGFESIAMTPNGKIYAALEIGMANSFANTTKANGDASNQTEMIRLLEYDPGTGISRMFAYMIDAGYPVGGNDLRRRNIKVGDMVALNNNELLVIEHGIRGTQNAKKIYKVTLVGATPITTEVFQTGAKTFKALEELSRSEITTVAGLTPVGKTLVIDLTNPGPGNIPYPVSLEKAEGMTILNPTTIAIANDNDFGIISPNADGKLAYTGIPSDIVIYHLSAPLDYQLGAQGTLKRGDEIINSGTVFFANQSSCVGGGMPATPITAGNPSTRDLAITGADFYETDSVYAQGAPRYALRRDNAGKLIPMGDYSLSTQVGGLPISPTNPVIVAPGATTTIYATFTATRPTKRFARAYLRTNAQNFSDLDTGAVAPTYGLLVFDLFARGTGSRLAGDASGRLPLPIVFREATVGDSTDAVLSIANPAICELRIAMADLRIFSGDIDQFRIVSLPTGARVDMAANEWVIPPGGRDSLLVRFMPRQPGSHRATIALRSNDSTLPSNGYAGRGIHYLDLFGTGRSTLSLTNIDFGIALIGGDQRHDLLHVTNSSPAATSIISISIVGADTSEFHEDAARRWTALPRLLTPGEDLDLGIVFAPIAGGTPGPRSAMVKVVLVSGDTITAWLTGMAGTRDITVGATSLKFDARLGGSGRSRQTLPITNVGTMPLTLVYPVISGGAGAADFSFGSLPRMVLQPGQTEFLEVTYHPVAVGTGSATITIGSDATSGPGIVLLDGTAAANTHRDDEPVSATRGGAGDIRAQDLSESADAETPDAAGVALEQSTPNPARDRVAIAYRLADRRSVALELYDGDGRLVRVLDAGLRDAGEHRVMVDLGMLSSGVYHCRLTAGGRVLNRSLSVVR